MKTIFENYSHLHPMMRAVLAHDEYDHDGRTNVISTTSIMKPTHMIALQRANMGADRRINIEGLVPSVLGTAIHSKAELALNDIDDELWKAIGVPHPEKLEVLQEIRSEMEIPPFVISGKYDLLFRYDGSKWQLGDWKSMSVWGMIIGLKEKQQEWIKQMSIYRYLNQDKEIDDIAVILYWLTDWSKTDARSKRDYPQSRVGQIDVALWSLDETKRYLEGKAKSIKAAMDRYAKTGATGTSCPEDELWAKPEAYAYYAKADSKRATKVLDNFADAEDMRLKAKDPTAYVEHRKGQKTRCAYCSVLEFCEQGLAYKVLGLVPEL